MMVDAAKQDRRTLWVGLLVFALLGFGWFAGLVIAPVDQHQGEIYRIIYMHVPSAFSAFAAAGVLFLLSMWTLIRRNPTTALWARASAEVGLIFTIVTLATGSIWGRPTWGVWWTWDARLTTTLILALLYAGYLIFSTSISPGPQRDRIAAALGIIIALDVPVIYQSVTWWRTLHQPPTLLREGGSTMDPEMRQIFLYCIFATFGVVYWLIWTRAVNLKLQQKLEQISYEAQQS